MKVGEEGKTTGKWTKLGGGRLACLDNFAKFAALLFCLLFAFCVCVLYRPLFAKVCVYLSLRVSECV